MLPFNDKDLITTHLQCVCSSMFSKIVISSQGVPYPGKTLAKNRSVPIVDLGTQIYIYFFKTYAQTVVLLCNLGFNSLDININSDV